MQMPHPANAADIMCSDWSVCENYVATGSGSGVTHVYDVRKFAAGTITREETAQPLFEFWQYVRPLAATLTVAWNPRKPVRSPPKPVVYPFPILVA
jgi:hypothetical protein